MDEPSHHPLEEGARHPQQELLHGGEVRYLREAQGAHQPGGDGEEVVGVLPVRLPDPLHQGDERDVLPEGEVLPRILVRVARYGLSLADLVDGPDHPYVAALLLLLADSTILLPLCLDHEEWEGSASAINFTAIEGR